MSLTRERARVAAGRACLAGLACLMLAAGCRAVPTTRYYVLDPRTVAAGSAEGVSIGVLPFDVDPPYDQDRIVYRVGDSSPEVGFYDYHRWAVPLSRMLPRFVGAAFRDVAGVGRIEPVDSERRYDLRLAGRVVVLEEVDTPEGQHIRLDVVLTLIDPEGTQLWSVAAGGHSESSADSVERLVKQARDLAERVLAEQRDGFARAVAGASR